MIYTPRESIDMLFHPLVREQANKQVCTKIEYKGYEISISMDSSHGPGHLTRSDIRVFRGNYDVSADFLEEGERMLYGDAVTLHRIMDQIRGA